MNSPKALICGINGQDGSLLAEFLLQKKYKVYGTSRGSDNTNHKNLILLNILNRVKVFNINCKDLKQVVNIISAVNPDEIYFLSGQSSVGLSFEEPIETFDSMTVSTLNFLEAIRISNKQIKFLHASSGDCFGYIGNKSSNENTSLNPRSPYAVAKASAHLLTNCYRDTYNLFASNAILYNHESEFRSARFVTQKIISTAYKISRGSKDKLELGNLDVVRDWGWAPEYVDPIWRIMQRHIPEDFIISTGEANSLEDFVNYSFHSFGLNWQDHVILNSKFSRPNDIHWSQGDPTKASNLLKWKAKYKMKDVINKMIKYTKTTNFL